MVCHDAFDNSSLLSHLQRHHDGDWQPEPGSLPGLLVNAAAEDLCVVQASGETRRVNADLEAAPAVVHQDRARAGEPWGGGGQGDAVLDAEAQTVVGFLCVGGVGWGKVRQQGGVGGRRSESVA